MLNTIIDTLKNVGGRTTYFLVKKKVTSALGFPMPRISIAKRNCLDQAKPDPRIIYLCPAINSPIGGIKVIYKHSEFLSARGVRAGIYHPEIPGFSCSWFHHKANVINQTSFDPDMDFIVIPEVWAAEYGKQCRDLGLRYAIYVQNGYQINCNEKCRESGAILRSVYVDATFILSISEDTSEMISIIYPSLEKTKIVRQFPHVGNHFTTAGKSKVITYMPRKLPEHSKQVLFALRDHLPADWQIIPIHNKTESETAALLAQSSIFMSFCDREGYPLPPLEAGISGNIVVGYTGQGAKEYFEEPIYREIPNGDFRLYIQELIKAIHESNNGIHESSAFNDSVKLLRERHSVQNEMQFVENFANRVKELYS